MDEYVVSCVEGTAEMGRPMIKKLLEANEKGDPLPGRAQILVTAMTGPPGMIAYLLDGVYNMCMTYPPTDESVAKSITEIKRVMDLILEKQEGREEAQEIFLGLVSASEKQTPPGEPDQIVLFLLQGIDKFLEGVEKHEGAYKDN